MGSAKNHKSVKLIIGLIFKEDAFFNQAVKILEKRFGRIDFQSQAINFVYTGFYEKEFGSDLKRRFISFQNLIPAQNLPRIKTITNRIEKKLSKNSKRIINIDPGYLTDAKLILATTKDFKHRVYLSRGIFAEVTLFFQDKTFCPWEWTYPDYKSKEYIAFFNQIREIYVRQI